MPEKMIDDNNTNRSKETIQKFCRKREKRHVKTMTSKCKFLNIQMFLEDGRSYHQTSWKIDF